MSKKKQKKVQGYKLNEKDTKALEAVGSSCKATFDGFRSVVVKVTGFKAMKDVTLYKGKGKKRWKISKTIPCKWSKEFKAAMARFKATCKPLWIGVGMTIKQVNCRFSQLVKATYGISMQKQKRTTKPSKVSGEYTVDVDDGKKAGKQFLTVYNELLNKYGKAWIDALIPKA